MTLTHSGLGKRHAFKYLNILNVLEEATIRIYLVLTYSITAHFKSDDFPKLWGIFTKCR